ncbi:hypothetical protein UR08_10600 [Listeria kieliensis]|uniref:Uncharacterized protein n=1 Tax=Listeria kieliensis TaxID=1621700 RepID=A0A3D8TRS0_9LIST|nr:hypothetical protein UR08_10600 [Listeria kieliensis]
MQIILKRKIERFYYIFYFPFKKGDRNNVISSYIIFIVHGKRWIGIGIFKLRSINVQKFTFFVLQRTAL